MHIYPVHEEKKESFLSRLFKRQTRTGPSGADPSALVDEKIEHEEAVLHVIQLPSFNGKLSQSSSELLVTYLTAPYLVLPSICEKIH